MIPSPPDASETQRLIREAIRARTAEIISEETEAVVDRVTMRLSQIADEIALKVLGYYEFTRDEHRLVITVNKQWKP